MNLTAVVEQYGESAALATGGLCIGMLFGFFAQRSRFCLRSAVIEFWHHKLGEKLSVWLLAFSSAVVGVQLLILLHGLDVTSARQLAARGSLSGALTGGLLFGGGMIMTRGCASRLLVLSANGNLRALLSGLIFAVTAQSALSGALAPLQHHKRLVDSRRRKRTGFARHYRSGTSWGLVVWDAMARSRLVRFHSQRLGILEMGRWYRRRLDHCCRLAVHVPDFHQYFRGGPGAGTHL